MASADFSTSSFRRYRRPWPFRADGEISRNKTHFFRPAGCGFTTLLRLGLGLRHVMLTCPQVGLVSAFCAYPPNFASDFLHPRPRGRKLVLGYLVPPNWPIGDFHSRPCVMSCVQKKRPTASADGRFLYMVARMREPINCLRTLALEREFRHAEQDEQTRGRLRNGSITLRGGTSIKVKTTVGKERISNNTSKPREIRVRISIT